LNLKFPAARATGSPPGLSRERKHWDARTTGGDYSEDVLARSEELKPFCQEV